MSNLRAPRFVPDGENNALKVDGADSRALAHIVDYLNGRSGFKPVLRGKSLVMLPAGKISQGDVEIINLTLEAARENCAGLVWRAIRNERVDGDIEINNVDVSHPGVAGAFDSTFVTDTHRRGTLATPLIPIVEPVDDGIQKGENRRDTLREAFPTELVSLLPGKFCILDGKTLVVNVLGYSHVAIDNLRRALLSMEIPGATGNVNDQTVFVSPTMLGDNFYFEFNINVNGNDAELTQEIRSVVETELCLFDALERA